MFSEYDKGLWALAASIIIILTLSLGSELLKLKLSWLNSI